MAVCVCVCVLLLDTNKQLLYWHIDPHNIEMSSYYIDILITSSHRRATGIDTQRKQMIRRKNSRENYKSIFNKWKIF